MKINRRKFLRTAAVGVAGSSLFSNSSISSKEKDNEITYSRLDEILARPVLKKELFSSPVIIDRVSLLRYGDSMLCKVSSSDGAEGICVSNDLYMISLYPIFVKRVQPFFIGKDAVELEEVLKDVYLHNYKLQSLALWLPVATIEMAVLDMLGKIANKSMGELIGEIHQTRIPLYLANDNRGRSAEESLSRIEENVREWPFKALKFKVAGRMHEAEYPPGRSEKLIPLVREAFGDDMTLYTDANGGYSVDEAVRIGKLMEDYGYGYFEEPVPFDWYEETKCIADSLDIPVAGGEQEPSLHNFRWLIKNRALQVVQPDQFYFGGMIQSMKVARMAEAAGKICTPHMSGPGLGYLYMMHFVSALPNPAPFHEFKGFNQRFEMECPTSSLTIDENGTIKVPTGPGLGVTIDPGFIAKHEVVKA